MPASRRFLNRLLGGVVLTLALLPATQAATCASRTLMVIAHPDDGLAFIHDSVPSLLGSGVCIDLVSMTSYYDDGRVISGREEGARALHELFTRGRQDAVPDTFTTATQLTYGNFSVWRYEVFNDDQVRLWYFRQPASTYPGFTPGSLYSKRSLPGLIDALTLLMQNVKPTLLLTLNSQGILVGDTPCDVQRNGVFSVGECDHYDHVGAAQLAKSAALASGLSMEIREHNTYDIAAGLSVNQNISQAACARFCEARDVYIQFDPAAAATPWGALLSASEKYRAGQVGNPSPQPPNTAQTCAQEGGTCTLPASGGYTVYYGLGTQWHLLTGLSGLIACNNQIFGDPAVGADKVCRYVVTGTGLPDLAVIKSLLPSGLCVGVTSGALMAGARGVLTSCASAPSFSLNAAAELRTGNLCLDAGTATGGGGRPLVFASCGGQASQRWAWNATAMTLTNTSTGLLLDVPYSNDAVGQALDVYPNNGGSANQRWTR